MEFAGDENFSERRVSLFFKGLWRTVSPESAGKEKGANTAWQKKTAGIIKKTKNAEYFLEIFLAGNIFDKQSFFFFMKIFRIFRIFACFAFK